MAVNIDVITGFLESGKTSFIKQMLECPDMREYEKTVLVICEEGLLEYDKKRLEEYNVVPLFLEDSKELTEGLFQKIMDQYDPDYILLEYNGTWDITELLNIRKPNYYKFRNIIFLSEANKFRNYLTNMATIIQPQIINSDLVVFNRFEELGRNGKKLLTNQIKNINTNTDVIFSKDISQEKKLRQRFAPFETYQKITPGMIITLLLLVTLCFIPFATLETIYVYTQSVVTVFLSILMQAIPFILLGAFISSFIQIIVPSGWILKQFSEHSIKSFFIASIAGFFVPVCDCGLVPMISGLLKKGTPLPQVMTFWLTSAAVNPVVILSVLYAFPDKPYLAVIRGLSGVIIGLLVGVCLMLLKIETKDVLKENISFNMAGANMITIDPENRFSKTSAVFQGAKIEFFRVFKYVILGAFVSAMLLTIMPQAMKTLISGNIMIQFGIMIIGAVFMSTCSTSNAFIARSFSSNFSLMPVVSFMVLGPMLDFKNMIILTEALKKGFLIKLGVLTISVGIVIFGILNLIV